MYSPAYGVLDPGDAGALIASDVAGPGMGRRTAAGDLDEDGYDDVVLASYADGEAGSVYVLFGPVSGNVPIEDAAFQLTGEEAGDAAGWAIAAGDIDGDAISELVVGSTNTTHGGSRVYVVGRSVFGE